MNASSLNEVVEILNGIIDQSKKENSRIGYFAALYRLITFSVIDGIANNRFQDGPRMERFDVVFANRYFDALHKYQSGQPTSLCWETAFNATKKRGLLIEQHILLGMNAHINLDLAIATADTMEGKVLGDLEHDYNVINDLLAENADAVENRVASVSPWFRFIDKVGGKTDEALIKFSIEKARAFAWSFAQKYTVTAQAERPAEALRHDAIADIVARRVQNPGILISLGIKLIRLRESNNVGAVINAIAGQPGTVS